MRGLLNTLLGKPVQPVEPAKKPVTLQEPLVKILTLLRSDPSRFDLKRFYLTTSNYTATETISLHDKTLGFTMSCKREIQLPAPSFTSQLEGLGRATFYSCDQTWVTEAECKALYRRLSCEVDLREKAAYKEAEARALELQKLEEIEAQKLRLEVIALYQTGESDEDI